MKKAFFAYPYNRLISETITAAVEQINTIEEVNVTTWEELAVNGRVLIDVICKEIRESELFLADLTDLNPNVLFELGYAISQRKKIWIIRDTTTPDYENNFKKLKILTTVGYTEYKSSTDIYKSFRRERPDLSIGVNIFDESISPSLHNVTRETVFYLKSRHETDPSNAISMLLEGFTRKDNIQLITDDPNESSVQPLSWYGIQIHKAAVIVCHLVNIQKEGAKLHNAKYSLVAGLAVGMDKDVSMLIHENQFSPADYRDTLHVYNTAKEASVYVRERVSAKVEEAAKRNTIYGVELDEKAKSAELSALNVGEWIAENEEKELIEKLFYETRDYQDALDGK